MIWTVRSVIVFCVNKPSCSQVQRQEMIPLYLLFLAADKTSLPRFRHHGLSVPISDQTGWGFFTGYVPRLSACSEAKTAVDAMDVTSGGITKIHLGAPAGSTPVGRPRPSQMPQVKTSAPTWPTTASTFVLMLIFAPILTMTRRAFAPAATLWFVSRPLSKRLHFCQLTVVEPVLLHQPERLLGK